MYSFDFDKELFSEKSRRFFSKKTGVFRELFILPQQFAEAIVSCAAKPADNRKIASVDITSVGSSTHLISALEKSLGEAVERYASAFARKLNVLTAQSYDDVSKKNRVFAFDKFNFFHENQISAPGFPYRKLQRDEKLNWVEMLGLVSGKKYVVPTDLVFLSHAGDAFPPSNTSGLAAHTSFHQAVLNALFELIERDALLFSWWTKTAFPIIELVKSRNPKIQKIISDFSDILPFVSLVLVELDLKIPTVITLFRGEQLSHPKLCVSSACHIDVAVAIEKSLTEMTHLLKFSNYQNGYPPPAIDDFNSSIKTFTDNFRYYINFGNDQHLNIFANFNHKIHVDELIEQSTELTDNTVASDNASNFSYTEKLLKITKKKLKDCDMDPLFSDVTTPDIEILGYRVIRVVEPNFIRLTSSYWSRNWGNARLYELKKKLGLSTRTLTIDDLNNEPVPLS